jgi:hypothetical protein
LQTAEIQKTLEAIKSDFEKDRNLIQHQFEREDYSWKNVHGSIELLSQHWLKMISDFRKLCKEGHDMDDGRLFEVAAGAISHRQSVLEVVAPLQHKITDGEFKQLEDFISYSMVVLLDIARSKEQRENKRDQMLQHVDKIDTHNAAFKTFAGSFLKVRSPDEQDFGSVGKTSAAHG